MSIAIVIHWEGEKELASVCGVMVQNPEKCTFSELEKKQQSYSWWKLRKFGTSEKESYCPISFEITIVQLKNVELNINSKIGYVHNEPQGGTGIFPASPSDHTQSKGRQIVNKLIKKKKTKKN